MAFRVTNAIQPIGAENRERMNAKVAVRTTIAPMATRRPALRNVAINVPVAKRPVAAKNVSAQPPWKSGVVRAASVKSIPAATHKPVAVYVPDSTAVLAAATSKTRVQAEVKCEEKMDISNVEKLSEAFSNKLLGVRDIDQDDGGNTQLVCIYINDIYDYLRELESKDGVSPNFLRGGITARMRGTLIDWLIAVAVKFQLLQETLYLTVDLVDRYLQAKEVTKENYQLVGVSAMFLASKYEEMYSPPIDDFSSITERAYTTAQIRAMEIDILKALNFNLSRPLPLHFLRRNSKAGEVDAMTHTLAKYFMELCLLEYSLAHQKPSIIAAAALCLAIKLLERDATWDQTLVYHSKYDEQMLQPVMGQMARLVLRFELKSHTVKTKYAANTFMKISCHPQLKSLKLKEIAALSIS